MNKWLTTASTAVLALTVSTTAFAHSYLGSSTPTDGETVTEPLQEITLNFDGKIEQGSFFDLQNTTGTTIDIDQFIIGDGTLKGTFTAALPNDAYTVNWSIMSADGHPLEGTFSFAVNAPIEEPVLEETVIEAPVTEEAVDTTPAEETVTPEQPATENEQSSNVGLIAVIILAVIGIGVIIARRKK